MSSAFDVEPETGLLDGALDVHVHTAPDLVERFQSDIALAEALDSAGMAGAVVKSHVVPTVGRVDLVNEAVGSDLLRGGVALNGAVGGLNSDAVQVALDLGAAVVWLPTAWSENHARQAHATGVDTFVGQRVPGPDEWLSVLEDDGSLVPEMVEILDLVAEADAILGTGHIAPEATGSIVDACAARGVRCLVNHPFFRVVDLSIERQVELADRGAVMEYCAYAIQSTEGHSVPRVAEAVDRVGAERALLATDFGQTENPPVEGLGRFATALLDAGLTRESVRTLVAETPRRLLE